MTTPPPEDPAWATIRARYEAGEEKVRTIAADVGLTLQELAHRARTLGWKLRGSTRANQRAGNKALPVSAAGGAAARDAPPSAASATASASAPGRAETTRATLARLKEMLQARVSHLEAELKEIGAEVDGLANDRQIKAVNLVVRTLEKVLDLDRDALWKRVNEASFLTAAEKREAVGYAR